jgi:hypothetical protein
MTSNDHTLILAEFTLNSSSTEDISAPFIEAIISASLNPKRRDKLETRVKTTPFDFNGKFKSSINLGLT